MKPAVLFFLIFLLSSMAWSLDVHSSQTPQCIAKINGQIYRCSLGKTGVAINKREGDNATPAGTFPLRKLFYRPDKFKKEQLNTGLAIQALSREKGWCDDPNSPFYNQEVHLPFTPSHEKLWREDDVYDLIIVVGYNDQPVIKNKGSAIFIHVAREGYPGTAGCIAFEKNDLIKILQQLRPDSTVTIKPTGEVVFKG